MKIAQKTKPLAVPSLSWPGPQRTGFSFWSRTQENNRRRGAGGLPNSTTASLADEAVYTTCFPCHEAIKGRDFVYTRFAL